MTGLLRSEKAHSSSQQGKEAAAGSTGREGERPTGRGLKAGTLTRVPAVTGRVKAMAASHSPAVTGEPGPRPDQGM